MDIYRAARGEAKEPLVGIAKSKLSKATKKNPGSKPKKILAPNSISKIHRFLHKFLGDAVRSYGYLSINPADRVEPPRKAKFEPVVYDIDMLNTLLDLLHGSDIEAPVNIICKTGMRSEEAHKTKWIDIKGTAIFIPDSKTVAGVRQVELPKTLTTFLKSYKKKQNEQRLAMGDLWQENGLVWCKLDGSNYNRHDLLRLFHIFADKHGLPRCRIHDLRHTYITHMLATGASSADLAAQVGHASVAFMLSKYAHATPTRREALAQHTDDIMTKKTREPNEIKQVKIPYPKCTQIDVFSQKSAPG